MVRWLPKAIADPEVRSHLLVDEGEYVIDEVHHHWAGYWRTAAEAVVAIGFFAVFLVSGLGVAWLPFALSFGFAAHAGWLALDASMDRFVVTNMRVFRIRGVFNRNIATMPMSRILDITVEKPALGRVFDFGHFTFESAAQAQGLRDIRYVGHPDQRDLTIQRVVQRAGFRRPML